MSIKLVSIKIAVCTASDLVRESCFHNSAAVVQGEFSVISGMDGTNKKALGDPLRLKSLCCFMIGDCPSRKLELLDGFLSEIVLAVANRGAK
jgi:hypothetical protein